MASFLWSDPCFNILNYSFFYVSGPLTSDEFPENGDTVSPGRRLVVPLHVCVLQGLRFVKARLLSMEIPAHINDSLSKAVFVDGDSAGEVTSPNAMNSLLKIDPYSGSWVFRLLEIELSNPTDVVFEVNVSVKTDSTNNGNGVTSIQHYAADIGYPKTRIDCDFSARVLIPLEHFKLPVLDGSFLAKDCQPNDFLGGKISNAAERNSKAELNASINNLIKKIKVRWQSGRNSSGELNIKDAIQAALQASMMDILLPEPLTFVFNLAKNGTANEAINGTKRLAEQTNELANSVDQCASGSAVRFKGSISAHEMTPMEVLIRNNTKEPIQMSLSVTCRDVAGENCTEGSKATVLWAGMFIS